MTVFAGKMLQVNMQRERNRSATERRQVVEAAYRESLVTKQCATSHGERHLEEAGAIPSWFESCELGCGRGQGPSLFYTADNLAEINARNQADLQEQADPDTLRTARKRRERRISEEQYSRRFRRALAKLGVNVRRLRAA